MGMATLPIFIAHIQSSRCCLGRYEKKVKGYQENPKTLGEHLRKRRLEFDQTQENMAIRFRISLTAYNSWEANRVVPKLAKWPEIVRFIGYDPTPPPTKFSQAVAALRRSLGLDKHQFAKRLQVDVKSVLNWEASRTEPFPKMRKKLAALASESDACNCFHAFHPSLVMERDGKPSLCGGA